MIDIFDSYATDATLEEKGAVINIGGDSTLTLARADNEKYIKYVLAAYEEHRVELQSESPKSKQLDADIVKDALAINVLLGWENIKYKGKLIKYSSSNAKKLLCHRDFKRFVIKEAMDIANYRAKLEDADVKN